MPIRRFQQTAGWWPGHRAALSQARSGLFGLCLVATIFNSTFASAQEARISEVAAPAKSILDPDFRVGSWIWARETRDQQLCRFQREFEIPAASKVVRAFMRITADNSYTVYLDGRELGRGGDWGDLTEHDLTQLLAPGKHVLAVEAFNDFDSAGLVLGVRMNFLDGRAMEIPSDSTWKIVPLNESRWRESTRDSKNWPNAKIIAGFRSPPWWYPPGPKTLRAIPLPPLEIHFWQSAWFHAVALSICGAFVVVGIVCIRLMGQLAIQSKAQRVLNRERARIARDIHDDLTAELTELILLGEVAQSALPSGSESRKEVGKVCEHARALSHSMNEIIWVVNSQRDTLRAFASYVCRYVETFLEPTGIHCRLDLDEEMPDFPCGLGIRRNLFLAVKEALHNAVRHSGATEITLRMHVRKQHIILSVEDNGKGFDTANTNRERNGLRNIQQRAIEAGGSCSIITNPGAGCRVQFVAPLEIPGTRLSNLLARFRHRRELSSVPEAAVSDNPSKSTA